MAGKRASTTELIVAAQAVLARYSQRITIRQLYYRLVASLTIENSLASYKRLVGILTTARKDGSIDPGLFVDLTRQSSDPYCFADLGQFLTLVSYSYSRSRWRTQPNRIEVWVEKEALATVFTPVCKELQVRLVICRGYPSVSTLYEAAERLSGESAEGDVYIRYFGDHDPSGVDIPRCIREELRHWGHSIGDRLTVVALTQEQIDQYQLPPVPPKHTDSRTPGFLAHHGDEAVELDALEPDVLETLIRDSIEQLIEDWDAWESEGETEKTERKDLRKFIKGRK